MLDIVFEGELSKKDFKTIRVAMGLSRKELAEKLGVQKRTIDIYESENKKYRKIPHRVWLHFKHLIKKFNEDGKV